MLSLAPANMDQVAEALDGIDPIARSREVITK
jgi:hypothetical protein